MPSEQNKLFCDKEETTLKIEYGMKNLVVDTVKSVPKPKFQKVFLIMN